MNSSAWAVGQFRAVREKNSFSYLLLRVGFLEDFFFFNFERYYSVRNKKLANIKERKV